MADVYSETVTGALKLKGIGRIGSTKGKIKKKKKKNKAKEVLETIEKVEEKLITHSKTSGSRTPAQIAFAEVQAKRQKEKVMDLASKTHKQRVEELNARLDTMTEHYDIPKVSWTK